MKKPHQRPKWRKPSPLLRPTKGQRKRENPVQAETRRHFWSEGYNLMQDFRRALKESE